MPKQGDVAPNAAYSAVDGSTASIAGHKGRKLILYFYPKDDTTGCTREAQDFPALAADFANAGADIVGISKDSVSGAVCEAFGVWVEKSMYGRKYMGIERATFLIGADGTIARVWRKVKVAGHAADVLEAATAL